MKTKNEKQRVARRDLLKFAGLGGVAGAAAIATGAGQSEAASVSEKKSSGYRETVHVRTYYDLAKF
jgi:hypothetical protein